MTIHQCKPPVIKGDDDHKSITIVCTENDSTIMYRRASSSEWVEYVEGKDGHFPTQADGKVFAKASRNRCCAEAIHLRCLFDNDGVAVCPVRSTHVLLLWVLHEVGIVSTACRPGTGERRASVWRDSHVADASSCTAHTCVCSWVRTFSVCEHACPCSHIHTGLRCVGGTGLIRPRLSWTSVRHQTSL